jgi:ribosomal protein S18 acetylase RimI-like enzyme
MVTRTARQAAAGRGVRRLNPLRDLGQVASVIEEGFGPDLTEPGQRALREMRFLSRLGPLLWWLASTSPDFREFHSGFVWVEEGQIVGTLHITRPGPYARRWFISNVAVQTAYRGRGIGRALTEAALTWAREQGGEAAFLRVRRDNAVAWSLYDSLGFEPVYDSADLELARVPYVEKVTAGEISLSPYHPRQWRQVRELARAGIPVRFRWLEPVHIADFLLSLDRRLADWWDCLTSGRKTWRLVAQRGERIVAAMAVKTAGRRGNHSLILHIHPDCRGKIEEVMVTEALCRLGPHRRRATVVRLPVSYPDIVTVLKRYGFVAQRTLTLMRRSLIKASPTDSTTY